MSEESKEPEKKRESAHSAGEKGGHNDLAFEQNLYNEDGVK